MRVLLLIDAWLPFIGGAQIRVKNLKKLLAEEYDCDYCLLHSPSANRLVRFLWLFWAVPQAVWLNWRCDFDLVHAHAYWPGLVGKLVSWLIGKPLVFTVHGSNLLDLKAKSLRAWLERLILTRIRYDQLISVSESFLKHANVNKKITVVSNGVKVAEFDQAKTAKKADYQILFVGRQDPVKGLGYLKKAMVLVKQRLPQAQLKVVSKEKDRSALIKEYQASHLFVLPSLSEGQPLTLLEAWAARLPVVVTAVGDNPKIVKDGVNGYLVPAKDSQALAEAIVKVLNDEQRQKLGRRGYQLVKREYRWDKAAKKVYQLYQQVLEAKGG